MMLDQELNKKITDYLIEDFLELYTQLQEWYAEHIDDEEELMMEQKFDLLQGMNKIREELDLLGMGAQILMMMQQQRSNIIVPQTQTTTKMKMDLVK